MMLAAPLGVALLTSPDVGDFGIRLRTYLADSGGRPVPLTAVAPVMQRALIATEDERFYTHDGVDALGLVRALEEDIAQPGTLQGGSTLTEQVAKIIYLHGDSHSAWRKLQEVALAVKLEQHESKRQILEAYLNIAPFGGGRPGIAAASRRIFATTPARLTLAQASLLAGLVQAPTALDPLSHPDAARNRQVDVLRSMVADGEIETTTARRVLARPLPLADGRALPRLPDAEVRPAARPLGDWVALLALASVGVATVLGLARLLALIPGLDRSRARQTAR